MTIEAASASVGTSAPKGTATGILARFFFGAVIPALIYAAVFRRLTPLWGDPPWYQSLNTLFVVGAAVIALLFNCWVTLIPWKAAPNAFFAGMMAPCIALTLEGFLGRTGSYGYFARTAYAVPVSTAILFCAYQAWRLARTRLRFGGALEEDRPQAHYRPSRDNGLLGKLAFISYLVIVIFAARFTLEVLGEPPSGAGLRAMLVTGLAALPWSVGLLAIGRPVSDEVGFGLLWICIGLNGALLWYFGWGSAKRHRERRRGGSGVDRRTSRTGAR